MSVAQDFRVEAFQESHLPLVAGFSEQYWSRPRSDSYYRWRYVDSQPFTKMFVALTDDQCLGMVCALRKDYLISGNLVPCLEIFDWHTLPGLKGSGVGIRVMRAMMREGVRLIGIGGTADVLKTLPAMGWQTVAQARSFELPLAGEFLESGLRERVGMRLPGERRVLDAVTAGWFRPRLRSFDGRSAAVARLGTEVQELYGHGSDYDMLQVPNPELLRWMTTGYAGTGHSCLWYFECEGRLRGWLLARVYETEQGREAAILDLYCVSPTVDLYAWMIAEAAVALAGFRPRVIRARATCPLLQQALLTNRFRTAAEVPFHTWPKLPTPLSKMHLTLNHGDAPFRPYPSPKTVAGTVF